MTQYFVNWSIDIDAETPEQAARLAFEMQTDPATTATFYNVVTDPTMYAFASAEGELIDAADMTPAALAHALDDRRFGTDDTHPDEPVEVCVHCDQEVGVIHYSDGDRYQPTPDLGDDFCFTRWAETRDKPAMYCEESLARESGRFRHEIQYTL